VAPDGTNLTS